MSASPEENRSDEVSALVKKLKREEAALRRTLEAIQQLARQIKEISGNEETASDILDRMVQMAKVGGGVDESNPKKKTVVKTTIPAEQKYVRRTTDEFKAGAEPVTGGTSHRMKMVGFHMTFDLIDEVKSDAKRQGITISEWYRAAVRKALREKMDATFEMETPVKIYEPD